MSEAHGDEDMIRADRERITDPDDAADEARQFTIEELAYRGGNECQKMDADIYKKLTATDELADAMDWVANGTVTRTTDFEQRRERYLAEEAHRRVTYGPEDTQ